MRCGRPCCCERWSARARRRSAPTSASWANAAPLARASRVRSPSRVLRSALRLAVRAPRPAAPAQEQTRGDPRRARPAARDLPLRPARRHPRSGHPAAGLRLRRPSAQRGGAAAGRADSATSRPCRCDPATRHRRPCPAWRSSSAGPRPASADDDGEGAVGRAAGRGAEANGSSAPTSPRARSSAPSTAGGRSRSGRSPRSRSI